MADFNINIDPYYMESITQFIENLNMPFSNSNFYESHEIFPGNLTVTENFPSFGTVFNQPPISTSTTESETKKRKSMEVSETCSSVDVTPQASESEVPRRSNSSRRGKINERLNCLRDIVPGCYKTMGMAMMLDEIINYVRSLQNQVEFLSMKLTAASRFHDFNTETNATQTMQRTKIEEARELEAMIREGYGRVASYQSTWSI